MVSNLSYVVGGLVVSLTAAVLTASPSVADSHEAHNWAEQPAKGPRGVDISQWNHPADYYDPDNYEGAHPDFGLLRSGSAVRFAIIKASDGRGPTQDAITARWFARDRRDAHKAGLILGTYHYGLPKANTSLAAIKADAKSQARVAAHRVKQWRTGYLPMALDLEEAPESLTPRQLTAWALAWLRKYEQIANRRPYLYSYRWFLMNRLVAKPALTEYPLWLAAWGRGPDRAPAVPGWPAARMWQFTSKGRIPGSGSLNIDLNVYSGGMRQLRTDALLPVDGPVKPRVSGIGVVKRKKRAVVVRSRVATGGGVTRVRFLVSVGGTPTLGESRSVKAVHSPLAAGGERRVRARIAQLRPGTRYFVRAMVRNKAGTVLGPVRSLKTRQR